MYICLAFRRLSQRPTAEELEQRNILKRESLCKPPQTRLTLSSECDGGLSAVFLQLETIWRSRRRRGRSNGIYLKRWDQQEAVLDQRGVSVNMVTVATDLQTDAPLKTSVVLVMRLFSHFRLCFDICQVRKPQGAKHWFKIFKVRSRSGQQITEMLHI